MCEAETKGEGERRRKRERSRRERKTDREKKERRETQMVTHGDTDSRVNTWSCVSVLLAALPLGHSVAGCGQLAARVLDGGPPQLPHPAPQGDRDRHEAHRHIHTHAQTHTHANTHSSRVSKVVHLSSPWAWPTL